MYIYNIICTVIYGVRDCFIQSVIMRDEVDELTVHFPRQTRTDLIEIKPTFVRTSCC